MHARPSAARASHVSIRRRIQAPPERRRQFEWLSLHPLANKTASREPVNREMPRPLPWAWFSHCNRYDLAHTGKGSLVILRREVDEARALEPLQGRDVPPPVNEHAPRIEIGMCRGKDERSHAAHGLTGTAGAACIDGVFRLHRVYEACGGLHVVGSDITVVVVENGLGIDVGLPRKATDIG